MRYFIFALIALAACENSSSSPDTAPVGLARLILEDPVRQNWDGTNARPLVTSIWYPATDVAQMAEIGIPPERPVFIGGYAARNAELSSAQNIYPLIVMSHGTGGAAMQMMWLGRELAAEGYIVAAVDHHGNSAAEEMFDSRGFRMPWERARDISVVLDLLLADPQWGPRIDASRIGAAGFSLGGYTVTALAGGRIDFDQFEAFCAGTDRDATCDPQSEYPEAGEKFEMMLQSDPVLRARMTEHRASYRDDRIRTIVAMAPALGQAFTDESLANIHVSYLAIAGSADDVAPPSTNAEPLVQRISGARLHLLPGAGHYVFLNRCNQRGKRFVPVCKDAPGISRTDIHQDTVAQTLKFFQASLAN